MPAQNPTPYKCIELDWNPAGHQPAGIYILSKPNVEIQIPVASRVTPAGYYPAAYSIRYDEQAKEHRIALTQHAWP